MTRAPRLRDWRNLLVLAAGIYWFTAHLSAGWLLLALLPGSLLVATGVSALLWPGEGRITQFMAVGAVAGTVLGLVATLTVAVSAGLLALCASVACFVLAGLQALRGAAPTEGAPAPVLDLATGAKAALDEALVGWFLLLAKIPEGEAAEQLCDAALDLERTLSARGWADRPSTFHRTPPPPDDAELRDAHAMGIRYQRLRFTSGYVADSALPGGADWAALAANRDCHAHIFRHPRPGRPWLLAIHGYRMGMPLLDLRLFPPALYHRLHGLNLVVPALPLHGPRRIGRVSGNRFLDGDLLDLIHAETQALWDLRRLVAWIRAQEPEARIGVLGYSLGGYNAALLAGYEQGLDFVVAGIPVSDFSTILWDHIPTPTRQYFELRGLDAAHYGRLLRVVSPLAAAPKLAPSRLHIFAGAADRVVPPPQPLALAAHWQRPVHWYGGGHLTFRGEEAVTRCIRDAMDGAGWALAE